MITGPTKKNETNNEWLRLEKEEKEEKKVDIYNDNDYDDYYYYCFWHFRWTKDLVNERLLVGWWWWWWLKTIKNIFWYKYIESTITEWWINSTRFFLHFQMVFPKVQWFSSNSFFLFYVSCIRCSTKIPFDNQKKQ